MGNRSKCSNEIVGSRIKYLREQKKLTQSALGELVSKGESTVRMWELGKSEPDIETLKILSTIFSVSVDHLIGNTSFERNSFPSAKIGSLDLEKLGFPIQELFELNDEEKKAFIEQLKSSVKKHINKS